MLCPPFSDILCTLPARFSAVPRFFVRFVRFVYGICATMILITIFYSAHYSLDNPLKFPIGGGRQPLIKFTVYHPRSAVLL